MNWKSCTFRKTVYKAKKDDDDDDNDDVLNCPKYFFLKRMLTESSKQCHLWESKSEPVDICIPIAQLCCETVHP